MIAAVAVWNYQSAHITMPAAPVVAVAPSTSVQPDRIFAALGPDQGGARKSDAIFHGGFTPDRIFKTTDL
jgi:hypothetical protein